MGKIKSAIKNSLQGLLVILGAVFLALALRIFLFASFRIPSYSMGPAIQPGDYVYVNKLIPGPRVYKNFDFLEGKKVETHRVKGVRKIRRNDVLVFNFPYTGGWDEIKMDLNLFFVKRCIAIPGDYFYIDHGIYRIKDCPDTLGCYEHQKRLSKMEDQEFSPELWNCFPRDTVHYRWTVKNFGPLYVPGAGDTIAIDSISYQLYKNLIEYETDQKMVVKEGRVFLGDKSLSHYVFRQNYYFMSGDWVFDSQDSRYWGLLPEDHILGKAAFIWQSKDIQTESFRWERFFKKIE